MKNETDVNYVIQYIEDKIKPYSLNEIGKSNISVLLAEFDVEVLLNAIDISFKNYISLDKDGNIEKDSVELFINKIGGIAHNNSLSPIEQKIRHIKNYAKSKFSYWNDGTAQSIINQYIKALRKAEWSEEQILDDLSNEVMTLVSDSGNWSQWRERMESWIEDILNWDKAGENEEIKDNQTILPEKLYNNTRNYIEQLAKQINASYENNLFDCTAVMMRRLMEVLTVLMFQNNSIENKILDKTGTKYINLDKMIKIANSEKSFKLTTSTQQDMDVFRELGNLSAHKIWYNSTKKDIETLILRYRAMIEELLYKSGIKN